MNKSDYEAMNHEDIVGRKVRIAYHFSTRWGSTLIRPGQTGTIKHADSSNLSILTDKESGSYYRVLIDNVNPEAVHIID